MVILSTGSVIFLSIVYHLFDAIFIQAPGQGHMGSDLCHIGMSEITPFLKLPMFSDIVKSLYIPASDPSWQQLVHAAVLLAGTVEGWVSMSSGEYARQIPDVPLAEITRGNRAKVWLQNASPSPR